MRSVRSKLNEREFKKQYDEDQRQAEERRLAPIKAAEKELQENTRKLALAEKEFAAREALLEQPCEALKSHGCIAYKPDQMAAELVTAAIQNSFDGLRSELGNQGIELTASGLSKLMRVAQINSTVLDLRDTKTWQGIFQYADELGLFNHNDVIRQETAKPTPVQSSQERDLADYSDAEIEAIDISTDAGRKLHRRIADAKILKGRIYPMLNAWIESLESQWGVVFDTHEHKVALIRACEDLMRKRSLPFVPKSFDLVRVLLSNEGRVLPQGLLLPSENLAQRVNSSDMSDYHARVEFAAETKRLREAEELRHW
jgi:DNA-binding response OmpR family regulator